jgi:hypothetical protein
VKSEEKTNENNGEIFAKFPFGDIFSFFGKFFLFKCVNIRKNFDTTGIATLLNAKDSGYTKHSFRTQIILGFYEFKGVT